MNRLIPVLFLALSLTVSCGDDSNSTTPNRDGGAPNNSVTDAGVVNNLDPGDVGSEDAAAQTDAGTAFAQGWTPVSPLAVGARQETAVVNLDGKVYVIGGYNGQIQIVPTVEAWNSRSRVWERVADLPVPMHHANAVAFDGKLYVLGFLGPGFAADGRCFAYDPMTDAWSPIASMPAGTERGSSAIGLINGIVYVFGGLRGGAVTDGSYYDPANDSWTSVTDAPRSFDHAAFGVLEGKLVVAGGRNQSIGSHVPDVDIYDPESDSWNEGAPMPTSRGGTAGAVYGDELFVFGGEGNPDEGSGVFPQVESYDPIGNDWNQHPEMEDPRHGMGAAGFDGGILVPGGARTQAFGAIDAADVYVP